MVTEPAFMSREHVEQMNAILANAPDVQRAAAELGQDYLLTYQMDDGPEGRPVYWNALLGPSGVRFELGKPPRPPDVVIRSGWTQRIRSLRAAKAGEVLECPERVGGDPGLLERLGNVLEAGRAVATVKARLPEL